MFRAKTKKPTVTREQMLDSSAAINTALRQERGDGGLVRLGVPLQTSPLLRWFPKLAAKAGGERRVELDEVGSFVWEMCDGETTVRRMIARLADEFKLNRKEAEVSLTAYLQTLARKGLVSLLVPRPDEASEGDKT